MKFSSVIVFALLSTVGTTLASPMKRAASAAVQQQNAADAEALNAKFATLSASSPCTSGQNACVNGQFAQCSNGKFALSPCAAGTTCCALPLVNSRGTSITCDTPADRDARIAAAKGSGGSAPASNPAGTAAASSSTAPKNTSSGAKTASTTNTSSTGGNSIAAIRMQNAADAISQQNADNALTASSPCTNGQIHCVGGQVGQCTGGKFALSSCAAGTQCFVLPLVNKAGTSVTCDTQADRDARIKAAQQGQS